MTKRKTYFEQVAVETVRKIAKLGFPDTDQGDTPRVKEERRTQTDSIRQASHVRARRNYDSCF
jgi:hypothetical protein